MSQSIAFITSCYQVPRRFTLAEAHATLQEHLDCRTTQCPRRSAALTVLVKARRYVLDPISR